MVRLFYFLATQTYICGIGYSMGFPRRQVIKMWAKKKKNLCVQQTNKKKECEMELHCGVWAACGRTLLAGILLSVLVFMQLSVSQHVKMQCTLPNQVGFLSCMIWQTSPLSFLITQTAVRNKFSSSNFPLWNLHFSDKTEAASIFIVSNDLSLLCSSACRTHWLVWVKLGGLVTANRCVNSSHLFRKVKPWRTVMNFNNLTV